MDRNLTLKDISQLLHISNHTLHFWESKGLIHFERNPENNYRIITPNVIFEIDNILVLRGMGVPISEIARTYSMTRRELEALLERAQERLEEEIDRLNQLKIRAKQYYEQIKIIETLTMNSYEDEIPDFERVVQHTITQGENWIISTIQNYRFVLVIRDNHPEHFEEGFVYLQDNYLTEREKILWNRPIPIGRWKTFLLKVLMENGKRVSSNLQYHIDNLIAKGYQTGIILARHLSEANESGQWIVYYKAWVQVLSE